LGRPAARAAARIAAFCLVILGAALLPGRLRAGAHTPADSRSPVPATAIAMSHRAGA